MACAFPPQVFKAFKIYETHRKCRGEWDIGDAVFHIFRRVMIRRGRDGLGSLGFDGRPVTCLLSDETQDLSLLQILLFFVVCPDRKAFSFAYDPAQCITQGRVFQRARLNDLWYNFWTGLDEHEQEQERLLALAEAELQAVDGDVEGDVVGMRAAGIRNLPRPGLQVDIDCSPDLVNNVVADQRKKPAAAIKASGLKPVDVLLNRNFRCSQSILDIAQTLVDVVQKYDVNARDCLGLERSYDCGERPTFVCGADIGPTEFKQALLCAGSEGLRKLDVEAMSSSVVEQASKEKKKPSVLTLFGADQVILVGNEEEKERVENLFGVDAILVLIIGEAKGLEFNDGIVWNLISRLREDGDREEKQAAFLLKFLRTLIGATPDAAMEKAIDAIEKETKLADVVRSSAKFSDLFSARLKELIVAVTRMKRRLIFYEESANSSAVNVFQFLFHGAAKVGIPVSRRVREVPVSRRRALVLPLVNLVLSKQHLSTTSTVVGFPRQSSRNEYVKKAHELAANDNFRAAAIAYRQVGDELNANFMRAAQLKLDADDIGLDEQRLSENCKKLRKKLLQEAADLYAEISQAAYGDLKRRALLHAAELLRSRELGRYEQAAGLYEELGSKVCAGECWRSARKFRNAGESFWAAAVEGAGEESSSSAGALSSGAGASSSVVVARPAIGGGFGCGLAGGLGSVLEQDGLVVERTGTLDPLDEGGDFDSPMGLGGSMVAPVFGSANRSVLAERALKTFLEGRLHAEAMQCATDPVLALAVGDQNARRLRSSNAEQVIIATKDGPLIRVCLKTLFELKKDEFEDFLEDCDQSFPEVTKHVPDFFHSIGDLEGAAVYSERAGDIQRALDFARRFKGAERSAKLARFLLLSVWEAFNSGKLNSTLLLPSTQVLLQQPRLKTARSDCEIYQLLSVIRSVKDVRKLLKGCDDLVEVVLRGSDEDESSSDGPSPLALVRAMVILHEAVTKSTIANGLAQGGTSALHLALGKLLVVALHGSGSERLGLATARARLSEGVAQKSDLRALMRYDFMARNADDAFRNETTGGTPDDGAGASSGPLVSFFRLSQKKAEATLHRSAEDFHQHARREYLRAEVTIIERFLRIGERLRRFLQNPCPQQMIHGFCHFLNDGGCPHKHVIDIGEMSDAIKSEDFEALPSVSEMQRQWQLNFLSDGSSRDFERVSAEIFAGSDSVVRRASSSWCSTPLFDVRRTPVFFWLEDILDKADRCGRLSEDIIEEAAAEASLVARASIGFSTAILGPLVAVSPSSEMLKTTYYCCQYEKGGSVSRLRVFGPSALITSLYAVAPILRTLIALPDYETAMAIEDSSALLSSHMDVRKRLDVLQQVATDLFDPIVFVKGKRRDQLKQLGAHTYHSPCVFAIYCVYFVVLRACSAASVSVCLFVYIMFIRRGHPS